MPAESSNHLTYYDILGIHIHATTEEIKKSFRRRVMECHPDRNPHRTAWAERQVRLLLEAYRTLVDAEKRLAYDQTLRLKATGSGPAQAPPPRRESSRPVPPAMMILLNLMAGNGLAATTAYDDLRRNDPEFSLLNELSERDYLDCLFLLGEEFERQGKFERAFEFYNEVYEEEREEPRRRFFFDEVRDRIRNLLCRQMARTAPPEVALNHFRRLLQMGFGRADDAFFHKKMAECYYRMGDAESARITLARAFALKPSLKGVQKICLKLGVQPPTPPVKAARP